MGSRDYQKTVSIVHRNTIGGTPENFSDKDAQKIKEMIREAVDYLGGLSSIISPGDAVLIKPNLVRAAPPTAGITTDPRVVQAVIELVQEETETIFVGDQPFGKKEKTRDVFKVTGIEKIVKKTKAKLVYFNEEVQLTKRVPNARALFKCKIPKTVLNCDVYINVPKMKTHQMTGVTLGMKNQWGLIPFESRITAHKEDLHQAIADLLKIIKPDLTIIDGIIAMEGPGPSLGHLIKDMNVIIAGRDVVATDAVASKVMGIHPMEIRSIRIAHMEKLGLGTLKDIEIKGAPLTQVSREFEKADWDIRGIYPNVVPYVGGACMGCMSWIHGGLRYLESIGLLPKLKQLTIIVGRNTNLPDEKTLLSGKPVLIVGDCAEKHKDLGEYIPGCSPWNFNTKAEAACRKHYREIQLS